MTPLASVERAAAKAAAARAALDAAIREARKTHPLRDVAKAAGVSYETVRRICR